MATEDWSELIELLKQAKSGVSFDKGLSDSEVDRAEHRYGFHFPEDLRGFLQTALPRFFPFPDWRSDDDEYIQRMLRWPLQGLLFDVENNAFWLPEWGEKPSEIKDAKMIAERFVNQAPQLIPIYSHRMMPDRPCFVGNPVLSIHQTDIIYYGFDLDDYFRREFQLPDRKPWPSEVRSIDFWQVDRWQALRYG